MSLPLRWVPGSLLLVVAACAGDDVSDMASSETTDLSVRVTLDLAGPTRCNGSTPSMAEAGPAPTLASGLSLPAGYKLEQIASIGGARELAALPNGDLLVGSTVGAMYIVPGAERDGAAGKPLAFKELGDSPMNGVAFDRATCTIVVGTQHGVYTIPYKDGDLAASSIQQIAKVREGSPPPGSDGDVHITTSVAVHDGTVYAGVGSSCNACTEMDPTRATIQQIPLTGGTMTTRATRIRNAIALAIHPDTGTLYAGGAGQDDLPLGHPYEFFDGVTLHAGPADYGWPQCEENRAAYGSGADCSATVAPIIELPAYSTIVGATFYSSTQGGTHAFPQGHRNGFFLAARGAWHKTNGSYYTAPRVAFVPMNGDAPKTPVDWNDPSKQWSEFVGGFQLSDGNTRIGRPTGIAVGSQGSLFIADDQNGVVYRVRPQ